MSKKLLYLLLIPALLLIGGYLALQVYLRTGNASVPQEEAEQLTSTQGSAAESSPQATPPPTTGSQPKKKTISKEKKGGDETTPVAINKDSAEKKQTSPLDLRPLFIAKLEQLVKKSSGGLYNLSVGDLDLDVLASKVSLHKVLLRPDEQVVQQMKEAGRLPQSVVALTFEDLQIEGINIDDAINSKSMDYSLIKLVKPTVEIAQYSSGKEKKENSSSDFTQGFLKEMEKLAIKNLEIEDGTIVVQNKTTGSTKTLGNVQVQMQDILVNEATRQDKDRFLFARRAELLFRDFETEVQGGLYRFKVGEAKVEATQKRVELKDLSFGSPLSKEAFVAKQTTATEKYDLSLPAITITGVDWWTAFNGEEISAGEVETRGGAVAVYFDRSLPPKGKMGSFPNQLLEKLALPVDVAKLKMQDLQLSYEEYNPRSGQSGTLTVDDITMTIANITNQKGGPPMTVEGSALLLQQVPLTASFTFSRDDADSGAFSARLHLDSFSAEVINPVAKPLGLAAVNRGRVHSVDVTMQGDERAARGEVLMRYDKLRLSIMKKKKDEEELKKRHLLSFLANVFVIKNDNPWWLSGKAKTKQAYFERDAEAGFMNLVWKTAFVGLLKTMGAPEKIAKKK